MRNVAIALVVGLVPTVGCVALLGDYDVNGTTAGDGGVADASPTDGAPTGDSPSDAAVDAFDAQSTAFTTCGVSSLRLIDTVDDAALGFDGALQTFRVGNVVRVVAQRKNSNGAWVYSFDPKTTPAGSPVNSQKIDLSGAGRYLDVRRLNNQAIFALLFMERDAGTNVARMKVFELPDTNLTTANSFRASLDFQAPPENGEISGALGGYAQNNEYFWAVSVPAATSGNSDLLIGHRLSASALPAPLVIYSGNSRDVRVRDMARSEKTQYIFNDRGPDVAGDPGSSYFPVPHDTVLGPINPVSLTPKGGGKPFVVIGVSGIASGSGIRAAFAEVDFGAGNGTPGQLRIGEIPPGALATFDGTTVPPAFTLGSLLEAPLGKLEARFFGEELLWVGTPPDPQAGQGLNFIWYNIKDRVIRSKQVGPGKLLASHMTIGRASLALGSSTAITADLDLVFTEEVGGKSFLQHATMNCVR